MLLLPNVEAVARASADAVTMTAAMAEAAVDVVVYAMRVADD